MSKRVNNETCYARVCFFMKNVNFEQKYKIIIITKYITCIILCITLKSTGAFWED